VTEEEKLERVARELCRAAGQDPDAKIRMGEPVSITVGDCTILKPLFVPAWKAHCREARRLAMSDAEHAEARAESREVARRPALTRLLRAARFASILTRRRLRRRRFVVRVNAHDRGGNCFAGFAPAMLRREQ
jgi:hypothetical protein